MSSHGGVPKLLPTHHKENQGPGRAQRPPKRRASALASRRLFRDLLMCWVCLEMKRGESEGCVALGSLAHAGSAQGCLAVSALRALASDRGVLGSGNGEQRKSAASHACRPACAEHACRPARAADGGASAAMLLCTACVMALRQHVSPRTCPSTP